MENNHIPRHLSIKNLIKKSSLNNDVNDFILVWEQFSDEIISIIGAEGFNALFERSIFHTQKLSSPLTNLIFKKEQFEDTFSLFKNWLKEEPSEQRNEVNFILLLTFTDLLAMLIGEELTSRILHSAWGSAFTATNETGFTNEQ